MFDIFNIFAQNIDSGYTLEPPCSNEYPQSMFWSKNKKRIDIKVGFNGIYFSSIYCIYCDQPTSQNNDRLFIPPDPHYVT